MNRIVMLDTGVLGMVTNPQASPEVEMCNKWMESLVRKGAWIAIPEIADYEVRRELLRATKTKGLARLDALKANAVYIPITTETMLKAAEFWAAARKQGKPTADDKALDGDVILAAQAFLLSEGGYETVIATTNVKHLSLFVDARIWSKVT
jgi:predicted nucleic acid-binding protein